MGELKQVGWLVKDENDEPIELVLGALTDDTYIGDDGWIAVPVYEKAEK